MVALLAGAAYAVFRYSRVQTWVVHRVSEYLSAKLHTHVSIKSVNIKLPKKIVLQGVYIEDLHKDTLLYAGEIKLDIKRFNNAQNSVVLNKVSFSKIYFNLKRYKGDTALNLDFILNAFASSDTSSGKPLQLSSNQLSLRNARFNYIDENDTAKPAGMNYSDMHVSGINADIDDIKLRGDTILCNIQKLVLQEKCGFELKSFSTKAKLSSKILDCHNLQIITAQSHIVLDNLKFKYDRYRDYQDFNNKVHMDGILKPSVVNMGDIAYYAPALNGMKNVVKVSGNVSGTVARLKAKGMDISFGQLTRLKGNISLAGLPNFEDTYIDLGLDAFQSSKQDIEMIPLPPFTNHQHITVPDNILNLGVFKFKGRFNGFAEDFVAYGRLETAIGTANADINLKYSKQSEATYSGHLSSEGFDIGKLWGQGAYFDKISLSVDIKGSGLSRKKMNTTVNGNVYSLGVYNYTYKNIELKSVIAKGLFNGTMKVTDENIDFSFKGNVDLTKDIPAFDFIATINKARLSKLHLINRDSTSNLSAVISARFKGKTIDDIEGLASINDLYYSEAGKKIQSKEILLTSITSANEKELKLNSEFIDADIKGKFLFYKLPEAFQLLADHYINNLKLYTGKEKAFPLQELALEVDVKNITPIAKIFMPDFDMAKNTIVKGSLNTNTNDIHLTGSSDFIKSGNNYFRNTTLLVNTVKNHLELYSMARKVQYGDSGVIDSVYINAHTTDSDIPFIVSVNKVKGNENHFGLNGMVSFENNQKLKILLQDVDMLIEQNKWQLLNPALFRVDSMRLVNIDGVVLYSEKQKININGIYAFAPNASAPKDNYLVNMMLENIDLSKFNSFTKEQGYNFNGVVNGTAKLYSNKNTAKNAMDANIEIRHLNLNEDSLGTLSVVSFWNDDSHSVGISANLVRGTAKILDLKGVYMLNEANNIDFTVMTDKLYLQLLARYMRGYVSNPRGLVSADLKVSGTAKTPIISGSIKLQRTSFTVDYLNTQYSLSDDFSISQNSIDFHDFLVNDIHGNTATLNGKIYHHNFKDLKFDLNLKAKNFQLLNTTIRQNDSYYGTAYGTGIANFTGPIDNLVLDIAMKTQRGTEFFIPLQSTGNVEASDFVTFINTSNTKQEDKKVLFNKVKPSVNISGLTLNMDLDITTDTQVQLIFDSKIGDIIKAQGAGNIKLAINTYGDFNMYGDYTIEKGDYLFTLQNIINKKFLIERGGTIRWNGNPADAEINLAAVYKLKASLSDLLQSQGENDIYKQRIPVECKLYMTNKLLNPTIKFDVSVPNLDETTSALVRNIINNNKENEVNNQVMSLLVLGNFSPPAGSVNATNSNSAGSGGVSNASELLSNQLSNIMSQLGKSFSKNVDFNVNYTNGNYTSSKDELVKQDRFDVGVSTQLFNDRVILNGSVGRTSNQNTSTMVGDFLMEYKINKDGRFRFKAFNKTVNNSFIIYNSPYTQGAGLSYKEEFSSFKDLMRHFRRKKLAEELKQNNKGDLLNSK